jgi:hypothetical protein
LFLALFFVSDSISLLLVFLFFFYLGRGFCFFLFFIAHLTLFWGMGVRHTLFPMPALGATRAASFPTPFSTASGVIGLIAGPSSGLRALNFG